MPCNQICGGPPRTPPSPRTGIAGGLEGLRNLETARLAQQPGFNAFVRISLQGSQTLGHRQYQEFRPSVPPVHFLDAIRQALAASVANQDIEHFWSVYNLEWPDTTARVAVFLRRVLPLESLLAPPTILEPSAATTQAPSEVCCISSDTEEASPAPIAETPEAADEFEAQVHDWRLSCVPLTLRPCEKWMFLHLFDYQPSRMSIGKDLVQRRTDMGPNAPGLLGMMLPPPIGQPLRGLHDPNTHPSNASTASGIKCTATATPRSLSPRPLQLSLPVPGRRCCAVLASSGGHSDDVAFSQSHHGTACRSSHPDWHPSVGGR